MPDLRNHHKKLLEKLRSDLSGNTKRLKVKKKTISNLFRYEKRKDLASRMVDLTEFNKALFLDIKNKTLEVQGLTTFEQIADYTLPYGLLPLITPELKHITIGGATVGIGVETNSYRFGFVHNGLLEADVLLGNGEIITCSPRLHPDLFYALGNSYGTLGYILRAKIKLRKVKPYMHLKTEKFTEIKSLLAAMQKAAEKEDNDSVEALSYSSTEFYLTTTQQSSKPVNLKSIYGTTVFYKEISKSDSFSLTTRDFVFRYDPDWFWNVPETAVLKLFRATSPQSLRNSRFYKKYAQPALEIFSYQNEDNFEALVQDWEVPWSEGEKLFNFFFDTVDLDGKPIILAPIKIPETATLYPMKENQIYLNLGCYCAIKRKKGKPLYFATKAIDKFCFSHKGIKMLYSSTFLKKSEFDRIYNGKAYATLKKKYDPMELLPTLFEKAVKSH